MTKKDYIKLSDAFQIVGLYSSPGVFAVCLEIAKVLAEDNPRFDRARWLKACGVKDEWFGEED